MAYRLLALLFLVTVTVASARAQYSKTIHKTFATRDIERIDVGIVDSVTIEHWAGNLILVQTDVRVYQASEGLFKFLVGESGRYDIVSSQEGSTLHLSSAVPLREAIHAKTGTVRERVFVKVMLPEEFVGEGSGPYVRQTDEAGR